ncbi:hypothetical protein RRG08_032240 [Elysia crispata]|uniref:Uncharacterized protein n=1 Tax=Elysia crispata TaxID=231223 RepID=A0AAE1AZT0_9GAST|nr:hypothetical protein RRG08_032240 [Elysia crispata]
MKKDSADQTDEAVTLAIKYPNKHSKEFCKQLPTYWYIHAKQRKSFHTISYKEKEFKLNVTTKRVMKEAWSPDTSASPVGKQTIKLSWVQGSRDWHSVPEGRDAEALLVTPRNMRSLFFVNAGVIEYAINDFLNDSTGGH